MKKIKLLLCIVFAITFALSSCKKNDAKAVKSAKLEIAAASKSMNSTIISLGPIDIISTQVNIANLEIEENSGFDGEQEGENNDGGNDDNENENENDDVFLAGPFSLILSDNLASIGNVQVYPGTFKKVNFDFITNSSVPFNGSSIVITGNYNDANSKPIPFTITSSFAQQVQLPLTGNGFTVTGDQTLTIDIVFDVNSWFSGIDLSTATVSNGEIIINSSSNVNLLNTFETNLLIYVEDED